METEQNYLYGLTVQGIQSYIFDTNKLKEIIGASEIIEQLCTTWFNEFLTKNGNNYQGKKLLNAAGNIRFKTDKATAEAIFKNFHKKLLEKSPRVPFSQAVVKIENGKEYEAIQELDKKLRGQRNKPQYAFDLGLMTRSIYRRTGGATIPNINDEKKQFYDLITGTKYSNRKGNKLKEKIKIDNIEFPLEFEEIAKGNTHRWLAVIHIDGNGMGLKIRSILENSNSLNKFNDLKDFSEKVSLSTINALNKAIETVVCPHKYNKDDKQYLPMRPIIIGGDDLTVIIRADLAIKFTQVYLDEFENQTKANGINENKGLTAAAGIAFVKEKFPFHYAVNLAEDLTSYAKNESKREKSCLHFHLVKDSYIDNYNDVQERELIIDNNFNFINGPYYINDNDNPTIDDLLDKVELLQEDDSPKNGIREWVDAKFNQNLMEGVLMDRLKEKTKTSYKKILNDKKAFIDYLSLLAVEIKTK